MTDNYDNGSVYIDWLSDSNEQSCSQ